MPVIREAIKEYDKLIEQAEALKGKIITFKETGAGASFRETKTLQLLVSAADHIVDNLTQLKQRIITDLKGD